MIKFFLCICIVFISGCSVNNSEAISFTCEDAADEVIKRLDKKIVTVLKETNENELSVYYETLNYGIQDSFNLRVENSPLRKSCAKLIGKEDVDPFEASKIIVKEIWRRSQS
jgi:hypothetical protein